MKRVIPIVRRSLLLFAFLCLFIGVAAADTDIQISSESVNDTVEPGETATVAEYEIGVRNDIVNLSSVSVTRLPFDTDVSPDSFVLDAACPEAERDADGNCPWVNESVAVDVTVPEQEVPDTYDGEVAFVFDDYETLEESVSVTVPEVVDWTVTDHRLNESVDIGSDGDLGLFTVENTGNVRTSVDVNVTGNLSEYLVVDEVVDLHAGRERSVPVEYRVPSDTPFGVYSGMLNLRGEGNQSDQINLSVEFVDEDSPVLEDVLLSDEIEATLSDDWAVLAHDNLEVASVTADVVRESTVTVGNTTQTVNETVTNVSFDSVEHTDTWEATFDATTEPGQYYVSIVVEDSAGNTVNRTEAFAVTALDAVTVLEENFEFDGDRPDAELSRPVIELSEETPVAVELVSFRELDANGSMLVGIRHEDAASPDTIEPGETVDVSEPGTYELVVEADAPGRFRGELVYGVMEQHVNVSETVFSGRFTDQECPPEDAYGSGEHHYKFEYTDEDCVDGDLQYIVTAPGENCLGYDHPSDCFNMEGADVGRIAELDDKHSRLAFRNSVYLGGMLLSWLVAVLILIKTYSAGPLMLHALPKKENVEGLRDGS